MTEPASVVSAWESFFVIVGSSGAALEARGVPRVVLNTAERNETARKLFASAGFRPTMVEMTRERGGSAC